jgi:competence protein ComEC
MPRAERANFNRQPMLLLAACFAAGILSGKFLLPGTLLPFVIFSAALAAFALAARASRLSTVLIALAFVSAGIASHISETTRNNAPGRLSSLYDSRRLKSGSPVEIEGILTSAPEPSADSEIITLSAENIRYRGSDRAASGDVRIFVPRPPDVNSVSEISNLNDAGLRSEISNLKYGSRIRAVCALEREDEFLNPGVQRKSEILDRIGVDATCSVKNPLLIEHLADESVFRPLAWVYGRRSQLIDAIRANLGPRSAGVMIASLLGDRHFLDKETADLFRDGGTFHILVISGLHITFIDGLLLLFLRQLTRNRRLQFAATNAVLWAYTLAVGADVPVVRAALMFTVVSFSYVIYRSGNLLNSLGLCGLILLVWRPSDLVNPSFLLTFVSVAAILACAYPLIDTLRQIGTWTPNRATPFPPNVPLRIRRFCETLYWNEDAWKIESKRNMWSAGLSKSPYLPHRIHGLSQRVIRYGFEGILFSLIVQIWMLPLSVVFFHRVSVVSVLLNLWVGFFIALESFAAVAGALAGHFSSLLAAGFFRFAEVFNWTVLALPQLFSDNGIASFRLPSYSGFGWVLYLLYFVPIVILAIGADKWRPFDLKPRFAGVTRRMLISALAVLVVLGGVIIFHPFSCTPPDGRLHIDFLDVGQGDGALVTFPDGQTLLVDGGGRINYQKSGEDGDNFQPDVRGIGEAVVSEFLWNRGYSWIGHVLATHADADHIQGLTDVARNFGVGSAIFGRAPMSDPDFAELEAVLRRRGIPVENVYRGDRLVFGDVAVDVLYPPESADLNAISDNDNSVVLRIVYGSRVFLLTGDIERTAEAALVAGGGTLTADLVKVAHHGSRTSSTQPFVDATGAKFAVISVGRSSPFGHPHPEVVERWKAAGAAVMTTGERGTISVSTDGVDLEVRRFVPE